jgi:hypothetical protein
MRGKTDSEATRMEPTMSTSDRTLNQVRAILTKLDRSIDEAREKRTHTGTPAAPAPAAHPAAVAAPAPVKIPAVPAAPASPGSQYGRAQPMPKAQPSTNVLRWKT